MEALGIGQLAKRGGVGIDTVRYYERNGLLTKTSRNAGHGIQDALRASLSLAGLKASVSRGEI
jgi:hypothetical protein